MKTILLTVALLITLISCKKEDSEPSTSTKTKNCFNNTEAETITWDNIEREYVLYIPTSYDETTATPMLMNFHGFGGSATDFMNETNLQSLADQENFILVYPQGSCADGLSHWNPSLPSSDNKSSADDLGFIEAMINQLATEYNVDLTRIYACGYSNGGMMSYGLAAHKSNLIAAFGSISGTMLDTDVTPSHQMPVIIIHGTNDDVLPYDGNSAYSSVQNSINYWTNFNNTDTLPITDNLTSGNISIEHFLYSNGDNSSSIEHYKVIDGNHIWFDLDINGNNTGEIVWDFLSKYDINGLR